MEVGIAQDFAWSKTLDASRIGDACKDGVVDLLAATKIMGLPSLVVGIAVFFIVLIAAWVGLMIGRRTGRRAVAARMAALGARLGSDGPGPDASLEEGLTYLEQVTGAATEAVTSQAADALRLRRALDTLPEGVIICDESGVVLYRNGRASELMTSRSGDALAAQAVTDLLQEAWTSGDAEKILELFGPPRSTLSIRAQLIDDGRRPVGVVALIEDISERRRLDEVRRDFIANVSHELKTPMGALGLLAETLMVERDKDVAARLADRIHREAFRVSRIIDDLLDQGVGIPSRDLDRSFERFYRVDLGRSRETGGTGLGLAIVRHVAQNHQGHVDVVSREGEGSTFTLVLPRFSRP